MNPPTHPKRFNRRVYDTLLPPSSKTVSQWAGLRRKVSVKSSAPGRWRNEYTPYLREPMDTFGSFIHPRVVIMSSSQVGKSEVCLNSALYTINCEPCAMMFVQPRKEDAHDWSTGRFREAVEEIPELAAVVPRPNSRKDGRASAGNIQFIGGSIKFVGSNAAAGLASTPIRALFLDEVDRYPESAGGIGGEGDPVGLAEARTITFPDRAIMYTSTPKIKGLSRIEALFESGDQRRWHCDCPDCGHTWVWKFEHIKFRDRDPETARLECPGCGVLHNQSAVRAMSTAGRWIATNPNPDRKDTASFHLWTIHAPWLSMAYIVREFLDTQVKPERLQTFVNTILGESWLEQGESLEFEDVTAAVEKYSPETLPTAVLVLTAAVDIQGNRLELYIAGWTEGEGHYGVLHEVFKGDPTRYDTWRPLIELVAKREFHTSGGHRLKVSAICVDTNYAVDAASKAIGSLKKLMPRGGLAEGVRGDSDPNGPIIGNPIGAGKARKNIRTPKLNKGYYIGVSAIKDVLEARLNLPPEEGGWRWPKSFEAKWFKQLTAEHRVFETIKGKTYRVWKKRPGRSRNEALDLCVYSYAAFKMMVIDWEGLKRRKPVKKPVSDNIPPKKGAKPVKTAKRAKTAPPKKLKPLPAGRPLLQFAPEPGRPRR